MIEDGLTVNQVRVIEELMRGEPAAIERTKTTFRKVYNETRDMHRGWEQFNAEYFGGAMMPPVILYVCPVRPTAVSCP